MWLFDFILTSTPTEEELKAIEAERIDEQVKKDTNSKWLKEIVEATKDEVSSDIDNTWKTWCEAVSIWVDWNSWSDYSEFNNADKLWNTPSPYLWTNKDK